MDGQRKDWNRFLLLLHLQHIHWVDVLDITNFFLSAEGLIYQGQVSNSVWLQTAGSLLFLSFTFLLVECLRVVDQDERVIAHSPPFLVEENNIRKLQSPSKDRSGVYRTWGFVREPEHYTPLTTLK